MSLKCFGKEKQVDIDKNMHVKFRREAKMLRALDESVTQYVGGRLFVKVHYGWGWQRTEPDATATSNQAAEAPPDFSCEFSGSFSGRVCFVGLWRKLRKAAILMMAIGRSSTLGR